MARVSHALLPSLAVPMLRGGNGMGATLRLVFIFALSCFGRSQAVSGLITQDYVAIAVEKYGRRTQTGEVKGDDS